MEPWKQTTSLIMNKILSHSNSKGFNLISFSVSLTSMLRVSHDSKDIFNALVNHNPTLSQLPTALGIPFRIVYQAPQGDCVEESRGGLGHALPYHLNNKQLRGKPTATVAGGSVGMNSVLGRFACLEGVCYQCHLWSGKDIAAAHSTQPPSKAILMQLLMQCCIYEGKEVPHFTSHFPFRFSSEHIGSLHTIRKFLSKKEKRK